MGNKNNDDERRKKQEFEHAKLTFVSIREEVEARRRLARTQPAAKPEEIPRRGTRWRAN